MRTFTLKKLLLTTVFFLLGSLAIHAADDEGLITEQITIKLDKAGTLPEKIDKNKKYKITNLKVIGDINGTDFRLIRDMAGCDYQRKETNGKLSILDLSETNIVRGGEPYIAISDNNLYTENNKIGDNTFAICNKLTSINLPSNVTTIGFGAFADCNSLTSINIPASVTRIDAGAFRGCCSLTSINIPANIRRINDHTFQGCSNLTSINIPSSITIIERGAFWGCSSLTNINIPANVTKIETEVFMECSSLTNINIPTSVTEIGVNAFFMCCSLTNIDIPSSVTKIGFGAFKFCSSLISIKIPSSVTFIEAGALQDCNSLTNINIPSSVSKIGNSAFWSCTNLKNIYVNWENPVEIPSDVFGNVDKEICTLYVPLGTLQKYKSANVWNEFENIVEYDPTGIANITTSGDAKEISRYSMNGQRLDKPAKGLNIVKYSNGSVKKVVAQ